MIGSSDGACPGAVINAAEDCIPFGWTDADLCPSLLVEESPDEPDASELEAVEVYRIQDAVVWMLGLDWSSLPIDNWNGEETYIFEDAVECKLMEALLDSVEVGEYRLRLVGYEFRNPFNAYGAYKAKFPREAYYEWWKANPNGLPCPAWFEDLRKKDESLEADKSSGETEEARGVLSEEEDKRLDISGEEIAQGIPVELMRGLLDPNDDRYCPKLLAAVRVKQEIIPRENKRLGGLPRTQKKRYEEACQREAESVLKDMGIFDPNKQEQRIVSESDKKAVARILDRDGRKTGRPKSM